MEQLLQKITGWSIILVLLIILFSFIVEPSAQWVEDMRIAKPVFIITLVVMILGAIIFVVNGTIQKKYIVVVGLIYAAIMIMYGLLTVNHFGNTLVDSIRIFLGFSAMIMTFYFLLQDAEPYPE